MKKFHKLTISVAAGCLMFLTPTGTAEMAFSDSGADTVYQQTADYNIAVPLITGVARREMPAPDVNTSCWVEFGYISSMDKRFIASNKLLYNQLEEYNNELRADADQRFAGFLTVIEDLRARHNTVEQEFFYNNKVSVRRADLRALSLLRTDSIYKGGARPMDTVQTTVFDTATGEKLQLSDVSTDIPMLLNRAKNALYAGTNATGITYYNLENCFAELAKKDPSELKWTLDYQGITFWFNPGEIAGEEFGVLSATVFFFGNESLFADNYRQVPSEYLWSFDNSTWCSFDDSAVIYRLEVGCVPGDGAWDKPFIAVGDKVYSYDQFECDSVKPMLFHSKVGTGLFLDLKAGDYHSLTGFAFRNDRPELLWVMNNTEPAHYGVALEHDFTEVLSRPDEMVLDTQINPLSTTRGRRKYAAYGAGMPQPLDNFYQLTRTVRLTLKEALTVEMLDESDPAKPAVSTETLPAGTVLIVERTDNESYVDARILSDGRYCRIKAELTSWPQMVNGREAAYIFEGISYSS